MSIIPVCYLHLCLRLLQTVTHINRRSIYNPLKILNEWQIAQTITTKKYYYVIDTIPGYVRKIHQGQNIFVCQINHYLKIQHEAMAKTFLSNSTLLQYHKKYYFAPNSKSSVISNYICQHISPNHEQFPQPHKNSPQQQQNYNRDHLHRMMANDYKCFI